MSDQNVHLQRGLQYLEDEDENKAIAEFDEAIRLNPRLAEAFYQKGNAYRALKQFNNAISDYKRAIELRPEHAETHLCVGICYARLLHQDEAVESFGQAIKLNPTLSKAFFHRGKMYFDLGLYEQACSSLEEALRLDPSFGGAKDFHILAKQKLKDSAIEGAKRALISTLHAIDDPVERAKQLILQRRLNLNPCLTEEEVAQFEKKHKIELPTEYRQFLLKVGNGGDGIVPLAEVLGGWIEEENLTKPFCFSKAWQWSEEYGDDEESWEDHQDEWVVKFGCGNIFVAEDSGYPGCWHLILQGEERGNMWLFMSGELCPTKPRMTFLRWYVDWILEAEKVEYAD
jgi:Tfp pilus assembly protein PilF